MEIWGSCPEQRQSYGLKTSKNPERGWLCCEKKLRLATPWFRVSILRYKIVFKNDQMGPLFQIFLIFQLLSGGVTNLFSCTKLLVGYLQKSCKLCHSHWFTYMTRKWLFFWGKNMLNLRFLNILKFSLFSFFTFKFCFSVNFQLLGMELVSDVYLLPILTSPDNNSISTGPLLIKCHILFSATVFLI